MLLPDEFRQLIYKAALPNIGEELAGPLLVIVEAVILKVSENFCNKKNSYVLGLCPCVKKLD